MIDYTSASIDFSLLGPEIALLVSAFIILLSCPSSRLSRLAPIFCFVGMAVALFLAVEQWGDQKSGFFGMVTCDDFGSAFKVIFAGSSMLIVLMSTRYLSFYRINRPEFYALLSFATMGMMVMANSTDLVVIFLGLEIMSVPLYVLAGFARRSLKSNEAGIKYFIMGSFASAFLLMGIAFIFGASGTTDLRRLVTDFGYVASHSGSYLYAGVALILVGFGFKVGIVPFHSWIPDVYQGAPTPVTAFFSVGPKAAGFAVLLRIFIFGFAYVSIMAELFWVLAVLTMTIGNVLALRQDNIKRMLAYSSIAHAGYMTMAFAVGGPDAVSAVIFYIVAYASFNLGAFAILTMLETRTGCQSDFSELVGFSKAHPYLTSVMALFMLALAGFPPTVGFVGKFYIFSAAVKSGFIWLAIIGVMNSFISVYYYLRVVKVSFFDPAEKAFVPVSFTPSMLVILIVTVAGTLGLGFFPQQLLELSRAAVFAFL